jgi:hypothetical protein
MYRFWTISTYYEPENDCLNFVCDNTRFIRHSTTPNSKLTQEGRISLQDIKQGDEITENFLLYPKYPWPELWEGPMEQQGDEKVKESYLAAHPEEIVVVSEMLEKTKYYVADAAEKGLGSFVGIAQKKGTIYQRILPHNLLYFPKEAWLTFFNSFRTDLCQSFCNGIMMYGGYLKLLETVVVPLDNIRFLNHDVDLLNLKCVDNDMLFLKDVEAGGQLFIDYASEVTIPCPWATFMWEFLCQKPNN